MMYKDLYQQLNEAIEKKDIVLIKELLSDRGTLYLHIDWHTASYVKILLDDIFGKDTPLTVGSFFTIDVFLLLWYSDIYDYRSVYKS